MRSAFILLIFAILDPGVMVAATGYEIHVETPEQLLRAGDDGLVLGGTWKAHVDGTRFRFDSGVDALLYDSVLSRDGTTIEALNSRLETWYVLDDPFFRLKSRFLSEYENARAKKITWQLTSQAGSEPSERVYTGTLGYTLSGPGGTVVDYDATIEVVTDTTRERALWLGPILPRTKHAAVNTKLDAADREIEGFPRRLSMTTTRRYRGGAPFSESMRVTVSNIQESPTDETRFQRPPSYRLQKPVVGSPGVEAR
jgi:hypothetical protein